MQQPNIYPALKTVLTQLDTLKKLHKETFDKESMVPKYIYDNINIVISHLSKTIEFANNMKKQEKNQKQEQEYRQLMDNIKNDINNVSNKVDFIDFKELSDSESDDEVTYKNKINNDIEAQKAKQEVQKHLFFDDKEDKKEPKKEKLSKGQRLRRNRRLRKQLESVVGSDVNLPINKLNKVNLNEKTPGFD